jgi:hypothetical protein
MLSNYSRIVYSKILLILKLMNKNIGVCGLDCAACDCYQATVKNDDELREKTARAWERKYGHPGINPQDLNCLGCNSEGPWYEHCFKCQFRVCGKEKGLESCGQCRDYPCEMIAKFHEQVPGTKTNCEANKS